jgi:predicted membrane channel-forming protein YqfA (hemolysin III family)
MSLELALTLLGLLLLTVGSIFYIIAMLLERHYDRKIWELEQKQKGKIK